MSTLILFQQARVDGGVRTGMEVDGTTAFMDFQEGAEEYDPALLWYIDLTCEGELLPHDAEAARQWLRGASPAVVRALETAAEELRLGFDSDVRPFERSFPDAIPSVNLVLCASAMRRVEGREIASKIKNLAEHWDETIAQLKPLASV
jgi:hypothetical protein